MGEIKIAICGLWHQGIVGAACLADIGFKVLGIDSDTKKVSQLNAGYAPLYEPNLDALLQKCVMSKSLHFSTKFADTISDADFVFVMHDTPVNDDDESDLNEVFTSVEKLAIYLRADTVVIVTAQVPVGTCDIISHKIKKINSVWQGSIAYFPENLRLGQAIDCFKEQALPVIGADSNSTFKKVLLVLGPFGKNWQQVSIKSAEMIKHALNTFLAVSICYGNEIGRLCDKIGADGKKIAKILKLEPRIGSKAMLMPGLAFSGGTLARDVQTLKSLAKNNDVEVELINGVWKSNSSQKKIVLEKLKNHFGNLSNKNIAILGLTYKENTSTLRRSAALELFSQLKALGVSLTATDPNVNIDEAINAVGDCFKMTLNEAIENTDAIILMTPCHQYKNVNFLEIFNLMRGNYILDPHGFWDEKAIKLSGLLYDDIGGGKLVSS